MGGGDPGVRPSDENLVRLVKAGDEGAARLLFERHLPALRAKAQARLPDALRGKVGASDVVQDAWLAAFLDLGDFEDRGDGSFGKWLRTILERRVADEIRRHVEASARDVRREVRMPTTAMGVGMAASQASPSAEVVAEERAAALRDEVARLDDDHREVIRLVHDEGLTLVEAGRRMGRSADAVRKLYGRALVRLGERLPDDSTS
jgi:RNA polymerase sigma-70 factor (ECF subfamily)